MDDFGPSVYSLGKLYALAERALPAVLGTPERKKLACEAPMASIAEIMRLLMDNRVMTLRMDHQIAELLDNVDMDTPQHIPMDLQGRWWAGYYAGKPAPDHGLTAMRKYAKLTQTEAADKIGVMQKDISRWERGEYQPSAESLKKLAEAYSCRIDDLI